MRLLDRYVLQNFLIPFVYSTVGFLAIWLVFDLSGTRFMDCGSARLIAAAGQWLPAGGRPVIRRPKPVVRRVLELTGLDMHCEIEP